MTATYFYTDVSVPSGLVANAVGGAIGPAAVRTSGCVPALERYVAVGE